MAGDSNPPNHPERLTRDQALTALRNLEGFEEGLTTRVGALTCMVWGIVAAGIFVSYGSAAFLPGLTGWAMAFLWLPWALAGVAVTMCAWKLHAVTLRGPGAGSRSWVWSLFFMAFFFVALMGLHIWGSASMGAFPYMLLINGLVAFIIVAAACRRRRRLTGIPLLVAGILIVASAFVLAALHLDGVAMSFASAAVVGVGYVGAGLVRFVRG